jgi:hypothetical protein
MLRINWKYLAKLALLTLGFMVFHQVGMHFVYGTLFTWEGVLAQFPLGCVVAFITLKNWRKNKMLCEDADE